MRMIWAFVIIAICLGLLYGFFLLLKRGTESSTRQYIEHKLAREDATFKNLVDPGEAPPAIRKDVKRGFQIMINTQKYAKNYVGGTLNCTNCHFAGGNTTGGAQGAISLVGVATKYPNFDQSLQRVIDLPRRINNCFTRSMNGKLVPYDSKIMLALVTYFQWISKDLPIYSHIPWLGLQKISPLEPGNAENGLEVYTTYCASCHGDDGNGGPKTPPVWGEGSFNAGAGFNRPELLSAFIYWNMPYFDNTPVLSEQQALNVATYILTQPRPPDKER